MARRAPRWLLLCLVLLSACRQVLALEHAELASDAGAANGDSGAPMDKMRNQSSNGVPTPSAACETPLKPACEQCRMDKCSGDDTQCLTDPGCRLQLDKYAICLGHGCTGDSETCASTKVTDPGTKSCINSACFDECDGTPLVSPCELYCACMTSCPKEQQVEDCITTCKQWPAEVRNCRRDHCERAQAEDDMDLKVMHCDHANGQAEGVCQPYDALPATKRRVCLDANESGWSCDDDSECCSSECLSGACK